MQTAPIGARIRQLRESSGLTQAQLAERAGISVRTIQYTESGRFQPMPLSRKALADALGVDVAELEGAA